MKTKTDDPFVPEEIRAKIKELQSLLDHGEYEKKSVN